MPPRSSQRGSLEGILNARTAAMAWGLLQQDLRQVQSVVGSRRSGSRSSATTTTSPISQNQNFRSHLLHVPYAPPRLRHRHRHCSSCALLPCGLSLIWRIPPCSPCDCAVQEKASHTISHTSLGFGACKNDRELWFVLDPVAMGLEFKPCFAWEDEDEREEGRCVGKRLECASDGEKQAGSVVTRPRDGGGEEPGVISEGESARSVDVVARERVALAASLAALNGERREYAVLVASEEDDVNEYKSFFSIVLDYPQFLGQGETRESAVRHACRLLHYAFGCMVLKGETIPPPSDAAQLEAKKVAMERDWQMVKLENFSMELMPLQFQAGTDYTARPPESDGEYESDREDEELFDLESRVSTQ